MKACKYMVMGVFAMAITGALAQERWWGDDVATMEAQIQVLRKKAELRDEQQRMSSGRLSALPKVASIFEMGGKRQARLIYADGRTSTVTDGDQVSPGVRVGAVGDRGVVVIVGTGKRASTLPLEFAIAATGPEWGPGGKLGVGVPEELLVPPPSVGLRGLPAPVPQGTASPVAQGAAAQAASPQPAPVEAHQQQGR